MQKITGLGTADYRDSVQEQAPKPRASEQNQIANCAKKGAFREGNRGVSKQERNNTRLLLLGKRNGKGIDETTSSI